MRRLKKGIKAEWNGDKLGYLCGHATAKTVYVVKYSSTDSGLLHLMCSQCYRQGIWYVLKVDEVVNMKTGEVYA